MSANTARLQRYLNRDLEIRKKFAGIQRSNAAFERERRARSQGTVGKSVDRIKQKQVGTPQPPTPEGKLQNPAMRKLFRASYNAVQNVYGFRPWVPSTPICSQTILSPPCSFSPEGKTTSSKPLPPRVQPTRKMICKKRSSPRRSGRSRPASAVPNLNGKVLRFKRFIYSAGKTKS